MGIAAVAGCKEDIVDHKDLAVAEVAAAASEAFPLAAAVPAVADPLEEAFAVPIEIALEDLADFPAVHLGVGMVHYILVLEQTLAFDQVVLALAVEDSSEEDTVQENQVCHNLEEEDHLVQVEGVGRRSYSMSTLGLLEDLLGCYHARIWILSPDRLCYGAFRKYL